jgi:hypothetical protein
MGCLNSTSAAAANDDQMYYDPHQNLICFEKTYQHIAANELKFVSAHDQVTMTGGDECYIVSVAWINLWIAFVKGAGSFPRPIDNKTLLDPKNSRKLSRTVVAKKDYRPVCKAVWEFYFIAYGGGPVILFHGISLLFSSL